MTSASSIWDSCQMNAARPSGDNQERLSLCGYQQGGVDVWSTPFRRQIPSCLPLSKKRPAFDFPPTLDSTPEPILPASNRIIPRFKTRPRDSTRRPAAFPLPPRPPQATIPPRIERDGFGGREMTVEARTRCRHELALVVWPRIEPSLICMSRTGRGSWHMNGSGKDVDTDE